jgi:hypothetical protein
MQARAGRALRRRELAEAVGLYKQLSQAFPEEQALAEKLALLRESLQPMALQKCRAPASREQPPPLGPSSPVQEGERLFALGDYAGAAAYHRALQERPDNGSIDGMKRRSTTHVVVQQPHNSGEWRRAVDFIGIDVHKKESQVCILAAEGEVVEKRIRTERERFAELLKERPRARILIESSTESKCICSPCPVVT